MPYLRLIEVNKDDTTLLGISHFSLKSIKKSNSGDDILKLEAQTSVAKAKAVNFSDLESFAPISSIKYVSATAFCFKTITL